MREKKKERKAKRGWTKGWKEKVIKEKVMIENQEKCWKKKCDTEKGLNRNKKWRFLGWFFRDKKKVKREKGWARNSRKSSKIKGLVTHTFTQKTRAQKKKKRKIAERGKTEDVFSSLWEKHNIFQFHQNRKVINEKLNV